MLCFIVNEHSRSGKGAKIWKEAEAVLKKKNIAYESYVTQYEGHAFSLAHDICECGADDIQLVVVGGDGTANEVINGMTHFEKVRFGVIPTGSGNDLARGLGITGTPTEVIGHILNCREDYVMDLGQVSWNGCEKPRLFAISAGAGLDALVCKKALKSKVKDALNKLHLGKLTYLFLTVQSLFTMQRTFLCLPLLVTANHLRIRGFEVTNCKEYDLKLKTPMVLHADGEYCGDVTEMHFQCLPKKLHVMW